MLPALSVVELASGIAGPLAGVRLADLGAAVVKIEPAGGDWLRGAAPPMPDSDTSAAFFALNRGKRSLALGAHPQAAAPLLDALLRKADVLITDRSDAELAALGIAGPDSVVCPANTRLIRVHVSPLGRRGPIAHYQGSELTTQAMAGYTRYLGRHGEPARRLGADVASVSTGIFALQAVLAALIARNRTGKGQRIDLSLLNSLLSMKSIHLAAQSDPDVYAGPRVGGANYPPERGWKTADEPIFFSFGGSVGAEGRPGWVEFVKEIGEERLLEDPRFDHRGRNSTGHGVDVHDLRGEYEKAFARFPAETLVETIRKHSGNASSYMRADQTLAHPQTAALGIVREVETAEGGTAKVRAFPARYSRSTPGLRGRAPGLGEHAAAIAAEVGIPAEELERLRRAGGIAGPADATA
ncbi:MAG TPA: CaiB/BaiF CoA-transferase family protein, partial [Thermodesulfobacteriota bacterium]